MSIIKKKHKHKKDRPRYVFVTRTELEFKKIYAKILGEGLAEITSVLRQ